MKNPRRIDISRLNLTQVDTSPPPPDSLFFKMWNANIQIAQASLQTSYIQGIKNANLVPEVYGGFTVNDAYYCYNGADDYQDAANRASDPTLKAYLQLKHDHYVTYNQVFTTTWRIKDASSVVPYQATIDYSEFETSIASQEDPIYALIIMIPCEYLWYWLANSLAPASPGNVYAGWINDNNYPDGAYAMGNFLATYQQQNPGAIDETKAINLYTQAMTYELNNFKAATGGDPGETWTIHNNFAQYGNASWDGYITTQHNTTAADAQTFAMTDPNISFFFFCRQSMVLNIPSRGLTEFAQGDAVFFSGPNWLGSAPQCDTYTKN